MRRACLDECSVVILVLWFVVVVDLCGIYILYMLVHFTTGHVSKTCRVIWSVHSYSQIGSMCRMTYDIGKSSHKASSSSELGLTHSLPHTTMSSGKTAEVRAHCQPDTPCPNVLSHAHTHRIPPGRRASRRRRTSTLGPRYCTLHIHDVIPSHR